MKTKPIIKKSKDPTKKYVGKNLKEIIIVVNEALEKYKCKENEMNENLLDISKFIEPVLNKKRNGSNRKLCDGLKIYSVLAKEITNYSWADIGFYAGEREHCTMLWHYNQYDGLFKTDFEFRKMARHCREKVEEIFYNKIVHRQNVVTKCNTLIDELPVAKLQQFFIEYNN